MPTNHRLFLVNARRRSHALVAALAIPLALAPALAQATPITTPTTSSCSRSCTTPVVGLVTAYVKATSTRDGYIVIGGVKYVLKAKVVLAASIKVGAVVNLNLRLDGAGKVTVCTVVNVQLKVSGLIGVYIPATSFTTGSLVIGGKSYVVAKGTLLVGITVGLHVTAHLTLNSAGQVTSCKCS